MLTDNYSKWYKRVNSTHYVFPKLCQFTNSERIHPLKQRQINEIVKACKDLNVQMWVFGSSTNIRCHGNSDIDLAIKGDYDSALAIINNLTDYNCDLINLNELKVNQLYLNICKQGVRIL